MDQAVWGIPTPIFSALISAASAFLAVFASNWLSIRKLRKEIFTQMEREKYNRTLNACQNAWKLLRFTTDAENPDVILTWVRDPKTKKDDYFLHKDKAGEFLSQLNTFFYTDGHGIFLPSNARPLLFEYRNIVFGFLLATRSVSSNKVPVDNTSMINQMKKIHQKLILSLREAVKADDNGLPQS